MNTTINNPNQMGGLAQGIFLSSDDHTLRQQIEELHKPDGRSVNVSPLFQLVEYILTPSTQLIYPLSPSTLSQNGNRGKSIVEGLEEIPNSTLIIERISSEIISKSLGGIDAHNSSLSILQLLEHLSWEAKVVLTLAAFSLTYGDFWLLVQIYSTNQLAKLIAQIKRLPNIVEHVGEYNTQFDAINGLIKDMVDITTCIVEFGGLPIKYITREDPELVSAMTYFPISVYSVIRSVISATTQIATLSSLPFEYVTAASQSWELSSWSHKLRTINNHLRKTLTNLYKIIDDKREIESYNLIKTIIYKSTHMDNMKVLKTLIYAKDDIPPIYDGSAKKKVHLDVLRSKNVLLLISNLDITHEELYILEQSYTRSKKHAYEIVWIPIIDCKNEFNDGARAKFEELQSAMPWYYVQHPFIIESGVIKLFRDDWHFNGKPILAVLDTRGKVVNPNAMHMMWIWQSVAFPFTSEREHALWDDESWRLELIVDAIDPTISDWIREGKYIFVYGGDDIEWIRKFTVESRAMAQALHIPLEMMYVGRSHNKELVRKVSSIIKDEKLSSYWQDLAKVWFFWARLESMILSKLKMVKPDNEGDLIFQEIQRLHSYDKGHVGWAVLARGSTILVLGHGPIVLTTVLERNLWKQRVQKEGFDVAFRAYYTKLHVKEYPCHRVQFPFGFKIAHELICPDCRRVMQKHTSFVCCHEDVVSDDENAFLPS